VSDAETVTEVGARPPPERPAGLRRRLGGWAGAAAVVFAALTAAAVTLAHIGSDSLSTNEAISFQIARLPWIPLPDVIVKREANMGAYYLLLHWWTAFGDSEASIRGLSLLAALLAIPILYGLVRRLFGVRPAMAAVVAFGVNPFMVMYAQYARSYTLLLLSVTAASYSFVRGVQERSWRWWAAYAVAGAVGVYAHLFAVLVLAAHLISLAFLPRRQVPWARLCSSLAGMTVLLVPLGLFLATRRVALIEWIERPGPAALPGLLARYAGSRPLLVAYAVAGAVAVQWTVRHWRRRGGLERWGAALVWSWLVVPILAALLISATVRPVFVPRYLIVSLPPLLVLVGVGLAGLGRPGWTLAALGLVVALSLPAAAAAYTHQPEREEDFRGLTGYILANAEPGDAVVAYRPSGRTALDYYLARRRPTGPLPEVVYPPTRWERAAYEIPAAPADYRPLAGGGVVGRAAAGRDRVWLVLSHGGFAGDPQSLLIEGQLAARYPIWRERRFRGLRLRLYQRRR
jgi:mannosyltransferase